MMIAASQVELLNTGLSLFIFAGLAFLVPVVGSIVAVKIKEADIEIRIVQLIVTGVMFFLVMVPLSCNTQGCAERSKELPQQGLIIRTGIDPIAPPVTLAPEPIEIPVRLKMTGGGSVALETQPEETPEQ